MKCVAFLTGTLNALAGAERMTATIANALAARGYRICIITLWDARSVFPLHPALTHVALFAQRPSFKRQYAATVKRLRQTLQAQHIDTLIEADTMLAWFSLPATLGLRIRRIGWEHCHFDENLGRRSRSMARRLTARFHCAVVVLTELDRQRWIEAIDPRCPVIALPNPLPFPFPESPALRESRTVLAVGRLTHAKGFDTLLRAWAQVAQAAPEWTLTIIGDGEARHALESLRNALGIAETVQFPGARTDIDSAYRQASIFCLSSRYEGFGLVLIEAMAHGLPIVSTNCEVGPRALLTHGKTAWIVPVEDAPAMADGLLSLIRENELAHQLATNARAVAVSFALDGIVEQWVDLLENIAAT